MKNHVQPVAGRDHTDNLAVRVSTVSIAVNLLLSAAKLVAGIAGKSSAMISDAVHSASDVLDRKSVV